MKHRKPHPRYLARSSYMEESVEGLALARVLDDPTEGVPPMPKTVAGIRVDQRIATIALVAIEQGFRAEAEPDGKALVFYSPDTGVHPVRVNTFRSTPQRATQLKTELRKAGVVFDGDELAAARAREERGSIASLSLVDTSVENPQSMSLDAALAEVTGDDRVDLAGNVMDRVGEALGMPSDLSNLATLMFLTVNRWHERGGLERLVKSTDGELATASLEALELAETCMKERDAATAERDALQAHLDKATAKAEQAARDCGEALARAKAAEERANKAESDLATIRRLLGTAAE